MPPKGRKLLFEKTAKAKKIDQQSKVTKPGEVCDPIRAAFDKFDRDKSGALSANELRQILARPGGGNALTDTEINSIIKEFDFNGDGELQFEEFEVMWKGGGGARKDVEKAEAKVTEQVFVIKQITALREGIDVNSTQIRLLKPGTRIAVRQRSEFATVPPTLRAQVAEPSSPSVLGWINVEKNGSDIFLPEEAEPQAAVPSPATNAPVDLA